MSGTIIEYGLPCTAKEGSCGSSNAMVRYEDNGMFCHKCQGHNNSEKGGDYVPREREDKYIKDLTFYQEAEYRDITDRRITADVCKKYGVKTTVKGSHLFPAYNKEGELIAVKERFYPDKKFVIHGDISKAVLFGMKEFPKTGLSITITEGEYDAMAAYRMTGSSYPHVSIWNGSGSAKKECKYNFEELKQFKSITLNFDNDVAGKKAIEEVGPMFPGRTKVMLLTDAKDACDYLKQNKGQKYTDEYHRAKIFTLGGIINGADTWEKYREKKDVLSIPFDSQYAELNQKTYGVRLGEIVLLTAGTGCVDADTEFFTGTKWKRIAEYEQGDKVLQSSNVGVATLVTPNEYIKLPCDSLTHVQSTSVDQVLSEEHDVVYKGKNGYLKKKFSSIHSLLKTSKHGWQGKIPTTFHYSGTGVDLTEGELRLQVAVMADGRIVKEGINNYTQMRFHKERKYLRLLMLLKEYDLKHKNNGLVKGVYEVIVFPKLADKHFDSKYYNCTNDQLRIITDECAYWDGRYSKLNDYTSTIQSNCEFIQFAYHSLGYRANISEDQRTHKYSTGYAGTVHWSPEVNIGFGNRHGTLGVTEYKTTDGYKYCFSVNSGILVLRRGGKIFLTGNSGKTQVLREWKYHLLMNSMYKIMDISLEEDVGDTVGGLMAIHANKRITLPDVNITEAEEIRIHDEIFSNQRFFMLDHEGSVEDDSLLDKIEYSAAVDGCKIIFLDHITIAVSDVQAGSENLSMDKFMGRLLKIVKRLKICVVVVSHLRKVGGGGKSFEEGRIPTEDDLKGSGSLKQIAMTTIAISRNKYAECERERNTTRFHVLKCRFSGRTGPCDYANFQDDTGRMVVVDPETFFDPQATEFDEEIGGSSRF